MAAPLDPDALAEWIARDIRRRFGTRDGSPWPATTCTRADAAPPMSLTAASILAAVERIESLMPPTPLFLCSSEYRGESILATTADLAVNPRGWGLGREMPFREALLCNPEHMRRMIGEGAGFRLERAVSLTAAVYRLAGGLGGPPPIPPLPPFDEERDEGPAAPGA